MTEKEEFTDIQKIKLTNKIATTCPHLTVMPLKI